MLDSLTEGEELASKDPTVISSPSYGLMRSVICNAHILQKDVVQVIDTSNPCQESPARNFDA